MSKSWDSMAKVIGENTMIQLQSLESSLCQKTSSSLCRFTNLAHCRGFFGIDERMQDDMRAADGRLLDSRILRRLSTDIPRQTTENRCHLNFQAHTSVLAVIS
jgi:hypothetical protein